MLELTRQMTFIPGSNLKGQVAGANWAFLLPEMRLERVVCFGRPTQRTLATLTLLGGEVTVVTRSSEQAPRASQPKINALAWDGGAHLPVNLTQKANTIDLILVTGQLIRRLNASDTLKGELRGLLKPDGWVYLEMNGPLERLANRRSAEELAKALGQPHVYWSTPLNGELHTAVPVEDKETINFFVKHGLYQPEVKKRVLKQAARLAAPRLVRGPFTRRHSLLVSATRSVETRIPPAYLRDMAEQAGIQLDHRWGLVAHGEYSTRKVLFYLFKAGQQTPQYIVKLVRDPAYNMRLENEHRALVTLSEKSSAGTATSGAVNSGDWFPRSIFFGKVNDLAVLAEGAVAGVDFRKRTTYSPGDACAKQVVDNFTRLAKATLDTNSVSPAQAMDVMMRLLNQFADIYQPERSVYAFLEQQIRKIGTQSQAGSFPLVFQHGDPGIWNMLVTGDNRVVVLDWESAETGGMPLWDLFYFLRSYMVAAARQAGIRDSIQGFSQYFFDNAAYARFVLDAVEQYRRAIGLPEALIEPLFYTCWLHRSLKEANRLAPQKLPKGHYYNLLRVAIQRRDTPALNRLFKTGPSLQGEL